MPNLIWKSDSLAERSYVRLQAASWRVNIRAYAWSPPTDVYETEASFVVRVEIAGMRQADFSISVEDNHLIISGVRTEPPERRAYHQMEIRFGEFSTAVELPPRADVEKAEAEYEDGFLAVVLPKFKSTEIPIKG